MIGSKEKILCEQFCCFLLKLNRTIIILWMNASKFIAFHLWRIRFTFYLFLRNWKQRKKHRFLFRKYQSRSCNKIYRINIGILFNFYLPTIHIQWWYLQQQYAAAVAAEKTGKKCYYTQIKIQHYTTYALYQCISFEVRKKRLSCSENSFLYK